MEKKINLAIICGGISSEREISFKSSKLIAQSLSNKKFNISIIEITSNNKWIVDRKPPLLEKSIISNGLEEWIILQKEELAKKIDVVFIALHGQFGEDGKIQAIFDLMKIPYTGSGVLASALGMNKIKCIQFVKKYGIRTPKSFSLNEDVELSKLKKLVKNKIGYPCIIKPNESGSSVGISLINSQGQLLKAIRQAFKESSIIMIEEYIQGREFTCGTLGNTGQTNLISLPPVEIIAMGSKFFDYKAKYSSLRTKEICPPDINPSLYKEIQKKAKRIHELLGCDGLTRSDFILSSKNNQLYFLEINTIPGLTDVSLCPKEAKAMGMTIEEFMEKQVELAILRHGNIK